MINYIYIYYKNLVKYSGMAMLMYTRREAPRKLVLFMDTSSLKCNKSYRYKKSYVHTLTKYINLIYNMRAFELHWAYAYFYFYSGTVILIPLFRIIKKCIKKKSY